jgi:hypothetical protein
MYWSLCPIKGCCDQTQETKVWATQWDQVQSLWRGVNCASHWVTHSLASLGSEFMSAGCLWLLLGREELPGLKVGSLERLWWGFCRPFKELFSSNRRPKFSGWVSLYLSGSLILAASPHRVFLQLWIFKSVFPFLSFSVWLGAGRIPCGLLRVCGFIFGSPYHKDHLESWRVCVWCSIWQPKAVSFVENRFSVLHS